MQASTSTKCPDCGNILLDGEGHEEGCITLYKKTPKPQKDACTWCGSMLDWGIGHKKHCPTINGWENN